MSVTVNEPVLDFRPEELPGQEGDCCGPRRPRASDAADPEELRWNRPGHAQIVVRGIQLLEAIQGSYLNARMFTELLWNNGAFQTAVQRGLSDADDLNPWADPWTPLYNLYAYHFCDADTLKTIGYFDKKFGRWEPFNAISEGERYFNLAVHAGRRVLRHLDKAPMKDITAAAHYLGLSLHFLTDLTQPMHAANFANVLGFEDEAMSYHDRRHSAFENRADDLLLSVLEDVPPLAAGFPDETGSWLSAGHIFRETAKTAKKVWTGESGADGLAAYTRSKPRTDDPWDDGGADKFIEKALKQAPLAVARLLAFWTAQIRLDLEDYGLIGGTVYQPTLPAHPDHCLWNEMAVKLIRKSTGAPSLKELTTLKFNADGTATFVARDDWRWSSERGTVHLTADPRDQEIRFRLHAAGKPGSMPTNVSVYIGSPIRVSDETIDTKGDRILKIDAAAETVYVDYPELGAVRPSGRGPDQQRWSFPPAPNTAPKIDDATSVPSVGWPRSKQEWEPWEKVKSAIFANAYPGIAVARRPGNHLDVFTNGGGKLQRREWFGAWKAADEIPHPDRSLGGRMTAASYGPQQLAVFSLAEKNGTAKLVHRYFDGTQSEWAEHPSPSGNDPIHYLSAIGWRDSGTAGKDTLGIYVVVGSKIMMREWKRQTTSPWSEWRTVRNGAATGVAATAVFGPTGTPTAEFCYLIDSRTLRQLRRTGETSWELKSSLEIPSGFTPVQLIATAAPWSGVTDIFLAAANGGIQHCTFTPWSNQYSGWSAIHAPAGVTLTEVIQAVRSPTRVDLFARDTTGQLWRRVWR